VSIAAAPKSYLTTTLDAEPDAFFCGGADYNASTPQFVRL
jgi:hypothetical protein